MTYEEYIDLLERLVEDGVLTLAEAEQLAGEYDAFVDEELLTPEQIPNWNDELEFATFAILIAILYRILRRQTQREAVSATLSGLSYAQRTAAFGAVQESYQGESAQLARNLANGLLTTAEWQTAMNESLLSHFRSLTYLGYNLPLSGTQEAEFLRIVRVQQAYLSRFADQYQLSVLRGEPWSAEYIAARAALYSGAMRGFAYRAAESVSDFNEGFVFQYIAVDDERTCSPCIDAALGSPYLANQGPYPGEVCEGRSRCRCRREPIYDPEAYQELIGRTVTA